MKPFIVLLMLSLPLYPKEKVETFLLPQHYRDFTSTLAEKIKQARSKVTILSATHNDPKVTKAISRSTQPVELYVKASRFYSRDIMYVALFKQVKIYILDDIDQTIFSVDGEMTRFDFALDQECLKSKKVKIFFEALDESVFTKRIKTAKPYLQNTF